MRHSKGKAWVRKGCFHPVFMSLKHFQCYEKPQALFPEKFTVLSEASDLCPNLDRSGICEPVRSETGKTPHHGTGEEGLKFLIYTLHIFCLNRRRFTVFLGGMAKHIIVWPPSSARVVLSGSDQKIGHLLESRQH